MHHKSNKFEQHKTDVANHKVDTAAPSDFAKNMVLKGADKKAFVSAFSSPYDPPEHMKRALDEYKKLNTKGDKK